MLQLSQSLINRPILSLRTGTIVATGSIPIFNPHNLKIEGFYCQDRFDKKKTLIMLYQNIRDLSQKGFIVNDHEDLVDPQELVRLKQILELNFELIGKP